jgi:uncharacterized repeat protein (TIGR01451 family)
MPSVYRISAVTALACLVCLFAAPPALAQNVPFKVYITKLVQLDSGVDPGLGYLGDYYAKVTINGVEQSNPGACNEETSSGIIVPYELFDNFSADGNCSARTPWAFSRLVPPGQTVHVKIQIVDSDLAFDDDADAKPGSGYAVEFDVDPVTGKWSGGDADADFNWPQTCSRPQQNFGEDNVNVCWQASFDTDDDGLLDVWETSGVDSDHDGVIDLDLAQIGANPLRKDVFVELDFLQAAQHTHRPHQDAIARVVAAFANAPVSNPDGTAGLQLHVDVGTIYPGGPVFAVTGTGGAVGTYGNLNGGGGGDAIPETGNTIIEAFEDPEGTTGTKFADLKAVRFNAPLRELAFRYVIFGHQTNARREFFDCTSGEASRTRRDFMVTLGGVNQNNGPCRGTDASGASVGSVEQQAGTFMHELGHTLGLRHGGDENVNDKPNYLSVMNYSFQNCTVPASAGLLPGGCDFSRLVNGDLLPDLEETDLDECLGIGGGLGFGARDWNMNTIFQGASMCGGINSNTSADTNNDGVCVEAGADKTLNTTPAGDDSRNENGINDGPDRQCDTTRSGDDTQKTAVGGTPTQPPTLRSFDDWGSIDEGLIGYTKGFGTGSADLDEEPDAERLEQSRRHLDDTSRPAVTLDMTGPASARPRDVLSYSVTVTNTGRGPAVSSVLTETVPDGTARVTDVGSLVVGGQVAQSLTYTVPDNACPGELTGASAVLAFKTFSGDVLNATDTVPLQILDVAAPSVALSVSPSVLWSPNHTLREVTATLAVSDNCDPNPAVSLVSITSNEPASGFLGQGDKSPDVMHAALGTDDRRFSLRAERGTGRGSTGRVYTITYRVTDASGNSTEKNATVVVPTSNRP